MSVNTESKPLVLVRADDCAADHFLLREAVRRSSIANRVELQFVKGGQALLDRLRSQAPVDLVLLDLDMPGLGGHQVLDMIRSDSDLDGPPVIVFTNSLRKKDRELSLAKGAIEHLVKPRRFSELVELIEALPITTVRWQSGEASDAVEPTPPSGFLVSDRY